MKLTDYIARLEEKHPELKETREANKAKRKEERTGTLDFFAQGTDTELCDELKECVTDEGFLPMIKHPLVNITYSLDPRVVTQANKMLAYKRELIAEHEGKGEYDDIILYVFERPWRVEAFERYQPLMTAAQASEILAELWSDTERVWCNGNRERFMRLIPKVAIRKHWIEDEEEFNKLPKRMRVYRGTTDAETESGEYGLSWTLDREKAEWFSQRYAADQGAPAVLTATVFKRRVLGYLTGLEESEIVVLPEHLNAVQEIKGIEKGQHS